MITHVKDEKITSIKKSEADTINTFSVNVVSRLNIILKGNILHDIYKRDNKSLIARRRLNEDTDITTRIVKENANILVELYSNHNDATMNFNFPSCT